MINIFCGFSRFLMHKSTITGMITTTCIKIMLCHLGFSETIQLYWMTSQVMFPYVLLMLIWHGYSFSSLIKQAEAHVLIRRLGLLLGRLHFGRRSCRFHLHSRSSRSSNSESTGISQEGLHLWRETPLHVRHAFSSNNSRTTSIRTVWNQASLSVGMNSTDMDRCGRLDAGLINRTARISRFVT